MFKPKKEDKTMLIKRRKFIQCGAAGACILGSGSILFDDNDTLIEDMIKRQHDATGWEGLFGVRPPDPIRSASELKAWIDEHPPFEYWKNQATYPATSSSGKVHILKNQPVKNDVVMHDFESGQLVYEQFIVNGIDHKVFGGKAYGYVISPFTIETGTFCEIWWKPIVVFPNKDEDLRGHFGCKGQYKEEKMRRQFESKFLRHA